MERVTGGESPSAETAVHPAEKEPGGTETDDETGTASEAPDDDSNLEPERPPSAEPSAPPSLSLSNHHAIDPMVGMDGVTPYDFMDGR